jgi:hypothetical protein
MASHVLAIDQGTTSTRAIVFDATARPVAFSQQELTQSYPQPGWVEHDPEEIWQSSIATARTAMAKAGLEAKDVAALGITNQRETALVWDRSTGKPIYPAIVWQDRRTAGICQKLKALGAEPRVTEVSGLLVDPYFSATKVAWILVRCRARATGREPASLPSAPSTAFCCGGSPAERCTPPRPPTPAGRCCSISTRDAGARNCAGSSTSPRPCCRRFTTAPTTSAGASRTCWAGRSASPGSPATSRPRPSARPASSLAW